MTVGLATLIALGSVPLFDALGTGQKLKAQSPTLEPHQAPAPDTAPGSDVGTKKAPRIRTPDYVAFLSPANSGVTRFDLLHERFKQGHAPLNLITTDRPEYLPLRFALEGSTLLEHPASHVTQTSDRAVTFSWKEPGLRVVRKLEAGKHPYQLWSTIRISNSGTTPKLLKLNIGTYHYVKRSDESGGFLHVTSAKLSHGVCRIQDDIKREDRKDLLRKHYYKGNVQLAAAESTYFVNALAVDTPAAHSCRMHVSDRGGTAKNPDGSLFLIDLEYPSITLKPGQSQTYRTLGYFGPKTPEDLRRAGHGLAKVINLGFFSYLAGYLTQLLSAIHRYVPNWGIAIIVLTLLVKLLLFPLTAKSFQSMARMRLLKPELDKLNELYKDDREKRGAATMELYRKHKINPLGGCLPQLLQLPIWWALYTSLSTNVQLYHSKFFLWWVDLSAPDPYFVLPLALGALMYVQQKLTPTAMDPAQAKVMLYMMPVMMTGFMLFLPSGLCLYILTNSVLSITQQKYFEHASISAAKTLSPDSGHDMTTEAVHSPSTQAKPRKATNRRSRRGKTKAART
ncbi:MAG: membrane protein insertase YidC [Myxococcales bacterium]|nr:membrane protein insertase YidC [Myxococcales bacterium]